MDCLQQLKGERCCEMYKGRCINLFIVDLCQIIKAKVIIYHPRHILFLNKLISYRLTIENDLKQ